APRNTPPEIVAKLNTALRAALKNPELIKRQEALGLSIINDDRLDPAGHKKYVMGEMERWAKVISASGQQPN
ncbi:MAG TPA: tripartite tricarboxylate transporter substrate-binding protein, partial [Eoetvoesiella sp.]